MKRNRLNRLPKNEPKRSLPAFNRCEKKVSGHRFQVAVKFLSFQEPVGKIKNLFQYTAIDYDTRASALKIYHKHHQQRAIEFVE